MGADEPTFEERLYWAVDELHPTGDLFAG